MSTSDFTPSLRAPAPHAPPEPPEEPAPKFDLERTPPPAAAAAAVAAADSKADEDKGWSEPAPPPRTESKPDKEPAKPAKAEPAAADASRSPRPAKVEVKDKTPAPAAAAKSDGKPAGKLDLSKALDKGHAQEPAKEAPAKEPAKEAPAKEPAKDKPAGIATAPADKKRDEPKKDDKAEAASPKPPSAKTEAMSPKPPSAKTEGPASKRGGRAAMELGGVFAVPAKGAKAAKADKDEDLDVDVDIDTDEKPIEFTPLITPPKPKPPAPQLRKVVLDIGDTAGGAPESKELPSVAFFSPVLSQMQLSQPAAQPLLSAPSSFDEADKPKGMKSSQGLLWALVIAAAGILIAGAFLLWSTLRTPSPAPPTRVADAPTPTIPTITAPVRAAAPEPTPAASAEPAATASAAPSAEPPKTAAADTAAKPEDKKEPSAAAAPADPKKVAAADTPAAPAEAKPEPKPADTPSKEPAKQPGLESNDIPFDKAAAAASLNSRKGAAAGCKQEGGPTGHAKVSVTFAPSGRVTSANVNGPPFAGTPVGGCIASKFRGASVPPFTGGPVTVHTSVAIF